MGQAEIGDLGIIINIYRIVVIQKFMAQNRPEDGHHCQT